MAQIRSLAFYVHEADLWATSDDSDSGLERSRLPRRLPGCWIELEWRRVAEAKLQ